MHFTASATADRSASSRHNIEARLQHQASYASDPGVCLTIPRCCILALKTGQQALICSFSKYIGAERLPHTISAPSHRAKSYSGSLAVMNPAAFPRDNCTQPLPQRSRRRVADAYFATLPHCSLLFQEPSKSSERKDMR
jgi:hypothetical protein